MSVSAPGTENGFLAPELIYRDKKVPTRVSLVDSYGLGMTMYFLRTSNTPVVAQSEHSGWDRQLGELAAASPCAEWTSLPQRFFRLIWEATRPRQHERIDVVGITNELDRLEMALSNPTKVKSTELWAEELASRSAWGYEWKSDCRAAVVKLGGLQISLSGDESSGTVRLQIQWRRNGRRALRRRSQVARQGL